jgi:glycosyltransferase involved in cell wall biosynthesis
MNGLSLQPPFNILQVSTMDFGGGAEKVAWDLFKAYRTRGYGSALAVGYKRSDDVDVHEISRLSPEPPRLGFQSAFYRWLVPLEGRVRGASRLRQTLNKRFLRRVERERASGWENFNHPGAYDLLTLLPNRPDLVHCHNLHGEYFDLRYLPALSRQLPVFVTLHDSWLMTGHCAHPLGCERWRTGCGNCPDLTIYPAISFDGTAYNWNRKRDIYARSRLYVATPSQHLMHMVEDSMLAPAVQEARVIPYGINLNIFCIADRSLAREYLDIPHDAEVILFTSLYGRRNPFKDYQTMEAAVAQASERLRGRQVLFLALGEEGKSERLGDAELRFIPFQKDPVAVARYYQAADVYIHAALADTFPNVILEAMACGTPIVATAIGGIPEQIQDGVTGFLTPYKDTAAMAMRIEQLIVNKDLRQRIGSAAAQYARRNFDLDRQVDDYLGWYQSVLAQRRAKPVGN